MMNLSLSNSEDSDVEMVDVGDVHTELPFNKLLNGISKNFVPKHKGNRYTSIEKSVLTQNFISSGLNAYKTMTMNTTVPSLSTIRRNLIKESSRMLPGKLYVDEVAAEMKKRNLPLKLWGSADLTKISAKVEYDATTNTIMGLCPSLNPVTGIPNIKEFEALTPSQMMNLVRDYPQATYIEAFIVKPMIKGNENDIK
jgi:hypothetical protein